MHFIQVNAKKQAATVGMEEGAHAVIVLLLVSFFWLEYSVVAFFSTFPLYFSSCCLLTLCCHTTTGVVSCTRLLPCLQPSCRLSRGWLVPKRESGPGKEEAARIQSSTSNEVGPQHTHTQQPDSSAVGTSAQPTVLAWKSDYCKL